MILKVQVVKTRREHDKIRFGPFFITAQVAIMIGIITKDRLEAKKRACLGTVLFVTATN